MNKYQELIKLCDKMTEEKVNDRTESCLQIMENKHLWALNNDEYKIINLIKLCYDNCPEEYTNNILKDISRILNNSLAFKYFYIFKDENNKNNAIIVTNDDKLYTFGSNSEGYLGFGHDNQVTEVTIVSPLCEKRVIDFKYSSHHIIARTSDGRLYSWGRNTSGVLGNGRENEELFKPKPNEYFNYQLIIEMSCGAYHSLVLSDDGEVY